MNNKKYILLLSAFIACTGMGMNDNSALSAEVQAGILRTALEATFEDYVAIKNESAPFYDTILGVMTKEFEQKPAIADAFRLLYQKDVQPQYLEVHRTPIKSLTVERDSNGDPKTLCMVSDKTLSLLTQHQGKWKVTDGIQINNISNIGNRVSVSNRMDIFNKHLHLSYARFLAANCMVIGMYTDNKRSSLSLFEREIQKKDGLETNVWREKKAIHVDGEIVACAFTEHEWRCAISTRAWNTGANQIQLLQKYNDRCETYALQHTLNVNKPMPHLAWKEQDGLVMRNGDCCQHVQWGSYAVKNASEELKKLVHPSSDSGWQYMQVGSSIVVGATKPTLDAIAGHLYWKYWLLKQRQKQKEREQNSVNLVDTVLDDKVVHDQE